MKYFVNRIGGSCHNFIFSLILHRVLNDESIIPFSDLGHAHDFYRPFRTSKKCKVEIIDFVEETKFDILKSEFDNFKLIFIWFSVEEQLQVEYNHFYKNYQYKFQYKNTYGDFYEEESKANPLIRSNLELQDLNDVEINILLKKYIDRYPHQCDDKLSLWSSLKEKYPDHIHIIQYNDIMNNIDIVIAEIENITGTKANEALIQSYKNYLQKQKKMPIG